MQAVLDVPTDCWGLVLSYLDDSPQDLASLTSTCRFLNNDLSLPYRDSLSPSWLRLMTYYDATGCLLTNPRVDPLTQYLEWVKRCPTPRWTGLCSVLAAPGCVQCGKPTRFVHYSSRLPLARRCKGCRGRTSSHGSGTDVVVINTALFGEREPIATCSSEIEVIRTLSRGGVKDGDTIGILGEILVTIGNLNFSGLALRFLGVGGEEDCLRVDNNALYFSAPTMLHHLKVETGFEMDDGSENFFCGLWVRQAPVLVVHCEILAHRGSPVVTGASNNTDPQQRSYHFAALYCDIICGVSNTFVALLPKSVSRFVGCSFDDPSPFGLGMFMTEGSPSERLLIEQVLKRRNGIVTFLAVTPVNPGAIISTSLVLF